MQIFTYQTVASTQDLAKNYLTDGNSKIAAFIAREQTAGYGKRGRSFYSPPKTGIYLSIAFPNFQFETEYVGLLTLAIGVAVVHILQKEFPSCDFRLKWVNDIYLNDKKVAGILTEKNKFGLIVGIGINISTASFPKKISSHVGSIIQGSFASGELDVQLIRAVIQATKTYRSATFLDEYRKLSYLKNKEVTLKLGQKTITGRVVKIDDKGRLVLNRQNMLVSYFSGEIIKVKTK